MATCIIPYSISLFITAQLYHVMLIVEAYDGLQWVPFRELFDISAMQGCYGRVVELDKLVDAAWHLTNKHLPCQQSSPLLFSSSLLLV